MMTMALDQKAQVYCANCPSTSRQAGDSDADCEARHSMIRPPPGGTPAQSDCTSAPQAERITNRISRGRIGRITSAGGGAAAGAAPGFAFAVAGAPPPEAAGAALPPPVAAATAFSQAAESFALFFS